MRGGCFVCVGGAANNDAMTAVTINLTAQGPRCLLFIHRAH